MVAAFGADTAYAQLTGPTVVPSDATDEPASATPSEVVATALPQTVGSPVIQIDSSHIQFGDPIRFNIDPVLSDSLAIAITNKALQVSLSGTEFPHVEAILTPVIPGSSPFEKATLTVSLPNDELNKDAWRACLKQAGLRTGEYAFALEFPTITAEGKPGKPIQWASELTVTLFGNWELAVIGVAIGIVVFGTLFAMSKKTFLDPPGEVVRARLADPIGALGSLSATIAKLSNSPVTNEVEALDAQWKKAKAVLTYTRADLFDIPGSGAAATLKSAEDALSQCDAKISTLSNTSNTDDTDAIKKEVDSQLAALQNAPANARYDSFSQWRLSLSRSQLGVWTLVFIPAWTYVFLVTGSMALPASAAVLLGMSLAAATVSGAIAPTDKVTATGDVPKKGGTLFVGDGNTQFSRVQFAMWTAVMVAVFVYHVCMYKELLDLDATTLSLMGMSNAAYLGNKQFKANI